MPDLLVEIGTEEIPASYIQPAARAFATKLGEALESFRIAVPEPTVLFTPRRIAVHFAGVPERGESVTQRRTGPAARIAFDADGNPTKAAIGFARGAGVPVESLEVIDTEKGPYVTAVVTSSGEETDLAVSRALPAALAATPFPKSMRWTGSPMSFARPVRNLAVLFGGEVVPVAAAGKKAGRAVFGHPFLAPGRFDLVDADLARYRDALRRRKVLVDPLERRAKIRAGLERHVEEAGAARLPGDLLDEVVNLTEWPEVIEGRIDPFFLDLPVEVLEVCLRVHLRFFPVLDESGNPEPRFLAVMNREKRSADTVREGNERVLGARLTDAGFFFAADREARLEDRIDRLRDKAVHRDLGSFFDKTARLAELCRFLAGEIPGFADAEEDASRAARLSKADLVTEMVGEFPELEGVMGRIYATFDGERPEVAQAIEDHYRPRGPDDRLPEGRAACLLAMAEKLDTLVSFFEVAGAPSGSSDPFGLRRQALGLLRISLQKEVHVPLGRAVRAAADLLGKEDPAGLSVAVLEYVRDRVYQMMTDKGFRYDLVRGALAAGFEDLPDLEARLTALDAMSREEFWPRLLEVVERTGNIARGATVREDGIDASLFTEDEERGLFAVVAECEPRIGALLDEGRYLEAASAYTEAFASVVHEFFERVFVNVDDVDVRTNRVALLSRVNALFTARLADLSRVEKGTPA